MLQFQVIVLLSGLFIGTGHGHDDVPTLNALDSNFTRHISAERKLYHKLMDPYVRYVRPVNDSSETIGVTFAMSLVNIIDLHEASQTLELNVWLRKSWTDKQLTWDPAEFDGITNINLPASKLWRPDIVLYNALGDYEYLQDALAVVYSSGYVMWIPNIRMKAFCPVTLYRFPYDTQTCSLKFGSWTYHDLKLNLILDNEKVDLEEFNEHREWDITNHSAVRVNKKYLCCPEHYPSITYEITLARKVSYFAHIYMAPAILMVLLLPTVFLLPPSSTEKIILGGSILIALTVMMTMIESFLPADHSTVPIIGMFYLTALVLTSISLVMAAFVINISNRRKSSPPPNIVKTIFINILGRLFCVRNDPYSEMPQVSDRQMSKFESGTSDVNVISNDDTENIMPPRTSMVAASDWRVLALVFDRLLLLVFTVVCVIVSFAMFAN